MLDISKYNNVFFVGIGGISMSSLALIMKKSGRHVAGYDRSHNNETLLLENSGIKIVYDYESSEIEKYELVVYTAAVDFTHPLLVRAQNHGLTVISRATLLGVIASQYSESVAIAGTHGKSSTTGMISCVCHNYPSCDATYVVGAALPFIKSAYKIGSDQKFIFEACEYKNSFLSFFPHISVVLNVELDHTDFFPSISAMKSSFIKFIKNSDICVFNKDNQNALEAATTAGVPCVSFAINDPDADYRATNISVVDGVTCFDIITGNNRCLPATLHVPGIHNVYNALAAFAAAALLNIPDADIIKGIGAFTGVSRRFEFLGTVNKARIYDDYAHHPDELDATLSAARSITCGRVICVFQPHTYSRLKAFFERFVLSLSVSDICIITDVFSAREADDGTVSGKILADAIKGAVYIPYFDEIASYICNIALPGDTVMIIGAGDVNKVYENIKNMGKST